MSFGSNLENLRKQKGWSQDKLADKLHISRQAISKWENGTSKPDIDNVKSISNIFSIGIDELLDNELPDRAAKLDVEKEEKKENVIQVIKYMIIAVVLIYLISVIGKFISLLTIVNGIQNYANLDNYHYVITTYEDNEITKKEEYWYDDNISKSIDTIYEENNMNSIVTNINFKEETGDIYDEINDFYKEIDYNEIMYAKQNLNNGNKMLMQFPSEIRKFNFINTMTNILNPDKFTINISNSSINIKVNEFYIVLDKQTFLPNLIFQNDKKQQKNITKLYDIELNDFQI